MVRLTASLVPDNTNDKQGSEGFFGSFFLFQAIFHHLVADTKMKSKNSTSKKRHLQLTSPSKKLTLL